MEYYLLNRLQKHSEKDQVELMQISSSQSFTRFIFFLLFVNYVLQLIVSP